MTEIETIDSYPLPFDPAEIIRLQEDALGEDFSPVRSEDDIERTVDGFHDRYVEELVRTDDWSVFRNHWLGHSNYIFFWNHMSGYGFKIDSSWEVMCAFVAMMDAFTDEFDANDFEPAHYPWELP